MLDRAKYIIVEKMDCESAILFPCFLQHQYMARMMNVEPKDVISAGSVQFTKTENGIEVHCSRGSVSLKIDSRPEDALIIKNQIIDTE